jgi:Domain of unknown function (DUF4157)
MKTRVDKRSHDRPSLEPASRSSALQSKAASGPRQQQQQQKIAQLQESAPDTNRTGLPETLKSGIEALSGMDMSGVRVHRNSDKPAALQAHAYAQGSDIHLGPGQEKHLPHEAWHVVQQAQGRVPATKYSRSGPALNDSPQLEVEATRMGHRAMQLSAVPVLNPLSPLPSSEGIRQLFGFKDYFWGAPAPALPIVAPVAAANGLPANHSAVRSSYLGWYDWMRQGASAGWDLFQGDPAVQEHPAMTGARTLGGVLGGITGGIVGGAIGTVGSLAHTIHRGVGGAWDHSRNAMEQADSDVEAAQNMRGHGLLANVKKKGAATLAGLFTPIGRGLASGFVGQGQDAAALPRPSAMSEIYTRMSQGSSGSVLENIGSGTHAALGGLLQTGIGGIVGATKSVKNLTDLISGLIAPGPISSITGPMGAHQMLEQSSDPGSKVMGAIGASGDALGALAQIGSAAVNIPASGLNYLLADRNNAEGQHMARNSLKEQWQGIGSNLIRGAGFTLADMSKGDEASWLTQQMGLQSALPKGMEYGAGGIYSAYHLWKGGWATHDYYKYRKMANAEHSDQRVEIGSGNTRDLDKFLVFAREKKKSAMLRNALALGSLGLGMGGLPVMAGAVGLGLGGMQLWHWLSDSSRDAHANWLINQAQNPPGGTTDELVNMLIPGELLQLITQANPSQEIIDTAKRTVEERLASW